MALESVRLPGTILQNGGRLGPYEITSQIGAGGMGEVYRATDTNLKRSVAIKVLQPSVASDADRLARFQREAEILASLNHPNIGAIYGLERADGIVALVMELVDGPTLAERIAQGAMPLDEALPIARQIANALEAAHDQGIIHRDLKPANVKLRPDGVVKVLDFGLAKFARAAAPESFGQTDLTRAAVSASPTIVSPVSTQVGMILGTAAYMSPEQARGRTADKRSDIWAFGCVLYEMLTGRRAFEGDEVSDVLAGVLKSDPRWGHGPGGRKTPPADVCPEGSQESPSRHWRRATSARGRHNAGAGGVTCDSATVAMAARLDRRWHRYRGIRWACRSPLPRSRAQRGAGPVRDHAARR
jgi:serine/threonine protein kinase